MAKFIHTSDWQIGMKGEGLGHAADQVRKTRIDSLQKIFSLARENAADFILISGDVFENNQVGESEVSSVIKIFNQNQDIPIYLLPGNHDYCGPGSVYERDLFSRVNHLKILSSNEAVIIKNVTLHPNPVFSIFHGRDNIGQFPSVTEEPGIHIGVAHGSLLGHLATSDVDIPIDPSCVENCGLDYLALGHWHSNQVFNDSRGVPRIAYPGTHEQTKYDENNAGYCLLVEIEGKNEEPKITPLKCGALSWKSMECKLSDQSSLKHLEKLLEAEKVINMLRLVLTGELDLKHREALEKTINYHKTYHSDLRVVQDSLRFITPVSLDKRDDMEDPTLNQVDLELRARIGKENDPDSRSALIEALSLLHRLVEEK